MVPTRVLTCRAVRCRRPGSRPPGWTGDCGRSWRTSPGCSTLARGAARSLMRHPTPSTSPTVRLSAGSSRRSSSSRPGTRADVAGRTRCAPHPATTSTGPHGHHLGIHDEGRALERLRLTGDGPDAHVAGLGYVGEDARPDRQGPKGAGEPVPAAGGYEAVAACVPATAAGFLAERDVRVRAVPRFPLSPGWTSRHRAKPMS